MGLRMVGPAVAVVPEDSKVLHDWALWHNTIQRPGCISASGPALPRGHPLHVPARQCWRSWPPQGSISQSRRLMDRPATHQQTLGIASHDCLGPAASQPHVRFSPIRLSGRRSYLDEDQLRLCVRAASRLNNPHQARTSSSPLSPGPAPDNLQLHGFRHRLTPASPPGLTYGGHSRWGSLPLHLPVISAFLGPFALPALPPFHRLFLVRRAPDGPALLLVRCSGSLELTEDLADRRPRRCCGGFAPAPVPQRSCSRSPPAQEKSRHPGRGWDRPARGPEWTKSFGVALAPSHQPCRGDGAPLPPIHASCRASPPMPSVGLSLREPPSRGRSYLRLQGPDQTLARTFISLNRRAPTRTRRGASGRPTGPLK